MSPQGDLELLIEREFNAPSQLVFRLWERSDHMLRWWGPEKFTAIEMDWELTPGRAWRGAMTSQEYGLSRFSGVIREVEKNKRIVFTFRWDEESGRDPDSIVTVSRSGRRRRSRRTASFCSRAAPLRSMSRRRARDCCRGTASGESAPPRGCSLRSIR